MNGSDFHVYAFTHESTEVLAIMKKRPKLVRRFYCWADEPCEIHWLVKQSELLKFGERLLRCNVEEVKITKQGAAPREPPIPTPQRRRARKNSRQKPSAEAFPPIRGGV